MPGGRGGGDLGNDTGKVRLAAKPGHKRRFVKELSNKKLARQLEESEKHVAAIAAIAEAWRGQQRTGVATHTFRTA